MSFLFSIPNSNAKSIIREMRLLMAEQAVETKATLALHSIQLARLEDNQARLGADIKANQARLDERQEKQMAYMEARFAELSQALTKKGWFS
jgi:molecular chaperone GrpE (heat shock protein)